MASRALSIHPQPGDRIEIKRPGSAGTGFLGYSHWAVSTGDDKVVHMTGQHNRPIQVGPQHCFSLCGQTFDKAIIVEDNLLNVVGEDKAFINNDRDSTWTPKKRKEIVQEAKEWCEKGVKYNLLTSNCEHFTNKCRYGEWHSDQTEGVNKVGKVLLWVLLRL